MKSLTKVVKFSISQKRRVLWLTTMMAVLSVLGLVHLELNTDFGTYSELSGHPPKNSRQPSLSLFFTPKHSYMNESQQCDLWRWIQNQAIDNRHIISAIDSPFELRRTANNGRTLHYPRMIGDTCYHNDASSFPVAFSSLKKTPWQNIVTDKENRDLATIFYLKSHVNLNDAVTKVLKSARDLAKTSQFDLKYSSEAAYRYHVDEGLRHDQGLNIFLGILFYILFYYFFRSWVGATLLVATMGLTSLFLGAFIAALGWKLDLLTNGIFLMTAVATIQDFIFISHRRQQFPEEPFEKSLKAVVVPCFLTTLTTVIGFSSLITADAVIIQKFGFLAGVGAFIEWFVVFLVLPAFIHRWPAWQSWTSRKNVSTFNWARFMATRPFSKRVTYALLCLAVLSPVGLYNLESSEDVTDAFTDDHTLKNAATFITQSRGWKAPAKLTFSENIKAPERQKIVHTFQNTPYIAAVISPDDFLNHFIAGQKKEIQDLILTEMQGDYYYLQHFPRDGTSVAKIYLNTTDPKDLAHLQQTLNSICGVNCQFEGDVFNYAKFTNTIIPTMLKSFAMSLLCVITVLVWLGRRLRGRWEWVPVLASLWGAVITMGLYGATNIAPINYLTCIVAAVLVGVTGDNAIHYLWDSKQSLDEGISGKAWASIQITIFMILGSLVLLGSYFTYPKTLGMILAVGCLLSLIGDLWVFQSILKWLPGRRPHDMAQNNSSDLAGSPTVLDSKS